MELCVSSNFRQSPLAGMDLFSIFLPMDLLPDNFSYSTYVPANVYHDLMGILKTDRARARYKDHYLLLLSILTSQLRFRFKEIRRTQGSPMDWFATLSSLLLQQCIGNTYNDIVRDLESWGFIWRSRSYIVGTEDTPGKCKSFGYKRQYSGYLWHYLASREEFYGSDTGNVAKYGRMQKTRVANRCLLKRIHTYMAAVKAVQMEDDMVRLCHEELAEHFSIDTDKAATVIQGLVDSHKITARSGVKEMEKVARFNNSATDPVSLYVKRDQYGRIHTNVTNLKKEIRRDCITCDGKPVASVDIKSSQGAFLCAILARFAGESTLNVTVDPYLDSVVRRCSWMDRTVVADEYERYHGLLVSHGLYEFFANELSEDLDLDVQVSRQEAKKEFLAMLFAPRYIDWRKHPVRAAVRRVWEQHFPNLLRCIDMMKQESYASLAHLMQKIESAFVYDRIIPAIMDEIGCHFCTVHDSVVVPEEFADDVKRIMDRELDACGIPTATSEEFAMSFPPERIRNYYEAVKAEFVEQDSVLLDA